MPNTTARKAPADKAPVRKASAARAPAAKAPAARAPRTGTPSPHAADSHDFIQVHGARENNLKDVSVEIPKRRLTVFTGISGSGKSSLVFDTVAAESQRLINETYSTFLQGLMPALARPEVDVLEGLTTAIVVDQKRMGADPRSTVGTATDANAMLRILFSRLGKPHIGSPRRSRSTSPRFRERAPSPSSVPAGPRGNGGASASSAACAPVARVGARSPTWIWPSSTTTPSRSPRVRSSSPATRWTTSSPFVPIWNRASSTPTSRSASSARKS